jgi:FXSXX-COOH protein
MTLPKQELESVIPDLRDLPLDRLAELGDSVLAHSIALYRERLDDNDLPFNGFNSRI